MPSPDHNRIDDLNRSLYDRNTPDIRTRRKMRYTSETTDVPKDWEHPKEDKDEEVVLNDRYRGNLRPGSTDREEPPQEERHGMSFPAKFLIGALIFCVLAVATGAYIFFKGGNFISGNNIEINISGPVSIPGGSPTSFSITVVNNNSVDLKTADLHVHFPAGTTNPEDTTSLLEDFQEVMGDIPSGGSVTRTVDAVIFGEQNLQKKITATVTYGIAGSNSIFTKESSYDVVINASPLVLTSSSLKETISGQAFDLSVNVKSNSANTIKNVILRATYPFGFKFTSSSLKPATSDNNVWTIGDIPPGGTRTINIRGTLTGEDSDLRVFHFTTGARSSSNPTLIGTIFMETEQDITIQKPFVSLVIGIDSDNSNADKVGSFGRAQTVNVKWSNNLPETLTNVVVTAKLAGTAYDKNYVNTWNGYFRSATDEVIWDQKTNPELATVAAGANGTLSFTITPSESGSSFGRVTNPEINITASAAGDRTSSVNVPLNTGTIARKIKVSSGAALTGRVLRNSGPFINSGPIPPMAEKKTTYTIVWSVENSNNAITNAQVTATLPPYVSWIGQTSPSTETVTFNKDSGTVTWNVGRLDPFSQTNGARKEAYFQVSVEPSVDQIGSAPIIVNQSHLTGIDSWTKSAIEGGQGYLTTSYSTDSTYKQGDEVVVKGF